MIPRPSWPAGAAARPPTARWTAGPCRRLPTARPSAAKSRGPAHAGRGDPGRDLGEVLGVERVGVARRLLRPRRPLAARHPARLAGARRLRRRAAPSARLFEAPTLARLAAEIVEARRSPTGLAVRRWCPCRATAGCRSPSPRSGSGSSTSWSRDARLQHPAGAAAARRARRAALFAGLGRDRAAPRGAAHHLPGGGRRAGAGDPPGAGPAAAGRSTSRPCRRRAGGRGARASRRRGRAAVRPRPRAAAAPVCCAAGERGPLCCSSSTTSSPTAGRWACWCASWRRSTARSPGRAAAAAGAAGPVRRLRGLAARRLAGERLFAGQLAYWRERLAGALPVLELPTDRPRPAVRDLPRRAAAVATASADLSAGCALSPGGRARRCS